MTDMDPLVPVLVGLVVDTVRFLDGCEDDEVDPDSAVAVTESVARIETVMAVPSDIASTESRPPR